MDNVWTCTVLGTRGSSPRCGSSYQEYGGNTSCLLADCGDSLALFDAGTGLSGLCGYPHQNRPIHIFLTHLHLDHILGLSGCALLHDPRAVVHLYGEGRDGIPLPELLDRLVGPPYWPVRVSGFRAGIQFHELAPDQHIALSENLTVHTLRGCHPNGCLYYRLEYGEKSIVYLLDCEPDPDFLPVLADFARNADLIVWDANFIETDLRPGWGHSTWKQGLALRKTAGAKQILMTHHASDYTDAFLQKQERLCREEDPLSRFAKEGMEILL